MDSNAMPDSIYPLFLTIGSRIVLTTAYNCSLAKSLMEQRQTDIMQSVHGFSITTWIITWLTVILMSILIHLHLKWNRIDPRSPKGSNSWTVFSYIFNQPDMKDINWTSRSLSLCLSLFVLLLVRCCFLNVIKSDKVTTYEPYVYQTYQDILDNPDIQIIVLGDERATYLKSFPPGHPYRQVIDHALNRTKDFTIWGTIAESVRIVTSDILKDRVFVHRSFNIAPLRFHSCGLIASVNKSGICHYSSRDAFDPIETSMNGLVSSRKFYDSYLYKKYHKYVRIAVDTGLELFRNQRLWHHNIITTPKTADCVSESIVRHQPEPQPFSLINYKYAFISLMIPIFLACIFLRLEIFTTSNKSRGKKIKVKEISVIRKRANSVGGIE